MKNCMPKKPDNLVEMDKFLERYNVARVTQERIKNLKRLMTNKETERVIKKFPIRKSPGPGVTSMVNYWAFKELTLILLQTLPKKQEERTYQVHPMSQN